MDFSVLRADVIRSVRHRWLLQYWGLLRGPAARIPAWNQVDMAELARVLDGSVIVDVVAGAGADAPRFRIYYQGVRVVDTYGGDCTGRFLDAVQPGQVRDDTLAVYRHVVSGCRPVYTIADMEDLAGRKVAHERLVVPFGAAGGGVSRILTMLETICDDGGFETGVLLSASSDMRYRVCAVIEPVP